MHARLNLTDFRNSINPSALNNDRSVMHFLSLCLQPINLTGGEIPATVVPQHTYQPQPYQQQPFQPTAPYYQQSYTIPTAPSGAPYDPPPSYNQVIK